MQAPPAAHPIQAPSPERGPYIGSRDQLGVDVLVGKYLYGGAKFSDTLGGFWPVVINPTTGITINGSDNTQGAMRFHNTAVLSTDELFFFGNLADIVLAPNSATSVDNAFVIDDRLGPFQGWVIYPAYTSGTVHPMLQVNDPAGTTTIAFFNGAWHGNEFDTDFYANYLQVSGAAVSSMPFIKALGSDTNLDILLTTKGSGVVSFNYAGTALGGGATATLGTIGGSGPTAAGQNSWIKVKVGTTAVWIPAWT